MFAASAQYLDLLLILGKVVQKVYPKTDAEARCVSESKKVYISNTTILEIENDFRIWRDSLPESLSLADKEHSLNR